VLPVVIRIPSQWPHINHPTPRILSSNFASRSGTARQFIRASSPPPPRLPPPPPRPPLSRRDGSISACLKIDRFISSPARSFPFAGKLSGETEKRANIFLQTSFARARREIFFSSLFFFQRYTFSNIFQIFRTLQG